MRRFGLYAALAMWIYGCQRPQKNVLNDGHLSNQGTSFLRCRLSGPFRSTIEPQHRNSHFFVIKREKYVAVLLIPLDGKFKNSRNAIPVVIQKIEDQSGPTDLMQRWGDGPATYFGIARRSGGTCLVPKGQGSRGCEIGSLLFPQRSGCEYANDQSHGR